MTTLLHQRMHQDLQLAGLPGHRTIAICAPASVPAIADDTLKAAPRVNCKVLDVHLAHERTQRAVELADLTARCVDRDAEMIEVFARGVVVGLVAEKPIHVLGDDDIE